MDVHCQINLIINWPRVAGKTNRIIVEREALLFAIDEQAKRYRYHKLEQLHSGDLVRTCKTRTELEPQIGLGFYLSLKSIKCFKITTIEEDNLSH